MKRDKKFLITGIIVVFLIGSCCLSSATTTLSINNSQIINEIKIKTKITKLERPTSMIFLLDCSASIQHNEQEGMKNAIIESFEHYYTNTQITLGVITFSQSAILSVPLQRCNQNFNGFLDDLDTMPTAPSGGSNIQDAVEMAYNLAENIIIMTDKSPGAITESLQACEAARLNGQKVSIAYYPSDIPSQAFPFEDCTNCNGQFPDQPIGYCELVSTPSQMTSTVSTWIHNDLPPLINLGIQLL